MYRNYDLHSHTTASDGSLSPQALVEHAKRCGVDVLAVTDHDVTTGLSDAARAASANQLLFVPGIEISVTWAKQTLHILGLNIDPDCAELQSGLDAIVEFRQWRAEEIARRLEKAGIADSYAGAQQFASGQIISRTHFARFLVANGYAKDVRQVFKKFLVNNKPGYVPGNWASLEDVMKWIRLANGIAVIAHPARYRLSASKLRVLFAEFKELGGTSIEVVSGSHSKDEIALMAKYADQFEFYASRGSDYHGPENAYADPSQLPNLPVSCEPVWHASDWPAYAV